MVNKDYLSTVSRRASFLLISIISGVLLVIFIILLTFLYDTIYIDYSNQQNNFFNDTYIIITLTYIWIVLFAGTFIYSFISYIRYIKTSKVFNPGHDQITRKCVLLTREYAIFRVIGYYLALGSIVPLIVAIMYFVNASGFTVGSPDYSIPALYSLLAFGLAIIISTALFTANYFINKKIKVLSETPIPNEDESDEIDDSAEISN